MKLHCVMSFKREEFACKCGCGFDAVDFELITVLQDVREFFDTSVVISSGCRCQPYNTVINGSCKSKHLLAKAADIAVKCVLPAEVYIYLCKKYKDTYGIGLYPTFVHLDVRGEKTRWSEVS